MEISFDLNQVEVNITQNNPSEISIEYVDTGVLIAEIQEAWRDVGNEEFASALEIAIQVFGANANMEDATATAILEQMALLSVWMLHKGKLRPATRARLEQIRNARRPIGRPEAAASDD